MGNQRYNHDQISEKVGHYDKKYQMEKIYDSQESEFVIPEIDEDESQPEIRPIE